VFLSLEETSAELEGYGTRQCSLYPRYNSTPSGINHGISWQKMKIQGEDSCIAKVYRKNMKIGTDQKVKLVNTY